jgi:hypothetical protein
MTNRIKERVIMGLQFGAQIPPSVVSARIGDVLDEIYERSEVARLDLTPISEVEDTDEYPLPALDEAPAGSRVARVISVSRVTRNNSGVVINRNVLDSAAFNVDAGIGEDGTAPTASVITLWNPSPATATDSLIVRVVAAFPTDDYVPDVYARDFEEAAACRVAQLFCSEVGKPWSDLNRAELEGRNFKNAMNRLRAKSLQRGTGRSTACRATQSFI